LVQLTEAGHAALLARRRRNAERVAELLGDLPESEVRALSDALASVLPAMRARVGSTT
jgi:DNA-binding MarR family transcriptional regulator